MKRFSGSMLAVAILLFSAGCDDDDSPTDPSGSTDPMFTAQLLPANEVPPVSNAEASGSGTVTVTLHVTRDASQTITSATADFQVSLTGFPAGTGVTAAHIHNARAGETSGFINNLGLTAGEWVLTSGAGNFTKTGIATPANHAQNMLNDPAGFYFNVHSALNPGGFARGQLVRTQ
jgi:hypothetical protein